MEFPSKYNNERDVEIPLLLEYIKAHPDIQKALDVGCAYSLYAPQVKKLVETSYGVDFLLHSSIAGDFDKYIVGDVLDQFPDSYDLVSAISTIEHYGVKQKPVENYQDKQVELVQKIGELSQKYIFITFPYGLLRHFPDEYSVVDDVLLTMFEDVLSDFELTKEFYSRLPNRGGLEWAEVEQSWASQVEHESSKGVTTVCILKGVRKDV